MLVCRTCFSIPASQRVLSVCLFVYLSNDLFIDFVVTSKLQSANLAPLSLSSSSQFCSLLCLFVARIIHSSPKSLLFRPHLRRTRPLAAALAPQIRARFLISKKNVWLRVWPAPFALIAHSPEWRNTSHLPVQHHFPHAPKHRSEPATEPVARS